MSKRIERRNFLRILGAGGVAAARGGLALPSVLAAQTAASATCAEKLGWRLGCCAYTFRRFTFYETVDQVAALGLKTVVGFNWQKLSASKPAVLDEGMSAADRAEAKKRLDDAGVKLACCYCKSWGDEDACRRLFDFARDMGIETLDGEPAPSNLDLLEKLCDEYQINLAIHNHAKPSPNWRPETLLAMFKGRSKRIGACCDTGHWARSDLNAVDCLRKLQGRILTFDLKDVNAKGQCVPFGTGKADISGILKELHRQQFRGVIGIENETTLGDLHDELVQSIAYFDGVAKKLAAGQ